MNFEHHFQPMVTASEGRADKSIHFGSGFTTSVRPDSHRRVDLRAIPRETMEHVESTKNSMLSSFPAQCFRQEPVKRFKVSLEERPELIV